MSGVKARVCIPYALFVTAIFVTLSCFSTDSFGSDLASLYTHRTRNLASQSFARWQSVSSQAKTEYFDRGPMSVKYSGGSKVSAAAHQAAMRKYLSGLAAEMKPSPKVAHIPEEHPVPVDEENPEKKWTRYYEKAKNSLRPHVEYEWNSNTVGHREMITLTEEHIETLKDNFDILMWYRNELDAEAESDKQLGARKFRLFLDYFIGDLLDGLPSAPKINLSTGKVAGDEWNLDEQTLREQLIMAYRYLIAKHQVYPQYEEFGPADRELLVSMMKIAFLMGARMHPDWFQETDVNLNEVSKKSQWKKPMVEALEVLQSEETDVDDYEEPCVISIPPPRKKPVTPKPPHQPEDSQKVEIIIRNKGN